MKRMFDFLVSLVLFVSLFPVFMIFALLIKLKLGSPIIFKQQRPGLYGKPFYLYKLRTMTNEKDHNGQLLSDYKRKTSFGNFLRRYSLDEYPQLINVMKGDISLVGPRPLLMEYLPLYTKEQSKRHNVRPGITGWAQVNGRNAITWEEKFILDVWYVNNRTFLLDMKILFLTACKVVTSEGINQPGNSTMERFTGSNHAVRGEHG
ncbi:sugar transferase [Neobacillus vireti]|uniref:Undecaprenyl-phosphate galactose phosphotransferase n=1 Tax=Neobacillus vireti LMG 21834 TaxID=1131730 RepID=A0AB94IKP0_9BACI|nr:sugar transferase [Neobacillus vireti]ETI67563.1 undecaprenyl-phosphate galactose phosphotransferase [Neobacillus vireti LMG 21834]KLT18487.1 sugar transferase [Neobacillus vireti]